MLYVADRHGWTRFVSMQNHYNLVYREEEREMLPLCREEGIGVIPWSPLARGFLAGNRRKDDYGDTSRAKTDDFAHELYFTDADFAVADARRRTGQPSAGRQAGAGRAGLDAGASPAVTAPIVGASKLSHLDEAVEALDLRLSPEDVAFLEEPYQPHPVCSALRRRRTRR